MNKELKKDLINIAILIVSFLVFFLIVVNNKYYYGSAVDWYSQHIAFPEYFRSLFYKTKNLFPDFAFNIGSGQNIYNFSYYGFLSPITLISYLLPFIDMTNYIIISTIVSVLVSAILVYFFIKKHGFSPKISLLVAFLFLFATSLTFHSHRHIMFINYMPFLIMGFYGVDRKLLKQRSGLLAISVFLTIMTSYYYSIGGIIALVIYGIYRYLSINKKITFKKFLKDGISFIVPIIIGVLMAGIIILPTFYVILNGRGETFNTITLKDLFLPNIHTSYFVYDSYGIGLTSIIILAIINLFKKNKEQLFLGIVLLITLLFPFINYILNGTMYIDAKALIPFLPLCIIAIAILFKNLFNDTFNYKSSLIIFIILSLLVDFSGDKKILYLIDAVIVIVSLLLYKKFRKELIIIIPFCIIAFGASIGISLYDELIVKESAKEETKNIKETIDYITEKDSSYYRINDGLGNTTDNKIYNNLKYYSSTLYSSIYNKGYNKFYYDVINNNVISRNRVITSSNNNLMFNIFHSHKYMFNKSCKELQGYSYVDKLNNICIYENDNVLPIGYASSNIMNEEDFNTIPYPYNIEYLLNDIVIEDSAKTSFVSNIKKVDYSLDKLVGKNVETSYDNDIYTVIAKKKASMTYKLDEKNFNKILFIRFKMAEDPSCSLGDLYITINGNKNKLTCAEWKYHNQNYTFDYVIADKDLTKLNISFNEGTFKIKDIEVYTLDYAYLENIRNNISEFNIEKMENDEILGNINVAEDGYFTISIPYDKGFVAYVDDEEVKIEKVNNTFMGFKIKKGEHKIKFIYKAPLKDIGLLLSLGGLLFFILVIFLESKKI